MTDVAMGVLVVLGYLLGVADPTDGQAVGRLLAIVAGLVVTLFLFYVALSGPAMDLLQRMWGAEARLAVTEDRSAGALARTAPNKRLSGP